MKSPRLFFPCRTVSASLLGALAFALTSLASGQTTFLDEDFEGSSGIPSGWTQNQTAGTANWVIRNGGVNGHPAAAHGGSRNACISDATATDDTTRLISPVFDTSGHLNIRVNFWHTQEVWYSDQDQLRVFYSTNGGSSWTQLAHYTDSIAAWTERSLTIPAASANTRIAFEGNAKYGYGACVDDIQVTGIADNLSEVSVSATDADASEVGPDAGSWTITRSGNTTSAINVNFSLSGNATSGSDYNLDTSSPVSFAAGETSKVVTLTPIDDAVGSEGSEVATLTLTSGTGYLVDAASDDISIYDDEGFDLNILVVGSTASFSDGGEHDVVHQEAFNATNIASHLQGILAQDGALGETVNVQYQEVFKTITNLVNTSKTGSGNITEHCYSLAQHYFWPDGKTERLAELRGENGTKWDYIILCSDPYIMANFPGMYAEGVRLIKDEVASSSNPTAPEVVLLAHWPENNTPFSADDFNEVVTRVGNSAGLTVVPAGKAWNTYGSKDSSSTHPTPRGQYLAAASIYSKLYNRSAASSAYTYASDGANIANHAHSTVQTEAPGDQYSGDYDTINVFSMKYVTKRVVSFRETGTSTEDGIRGALNRLDDVHRITFNTTGYNDGGGTRWDFNYGRGNDGWEDEKDYEVNPAIHDRAYGFPMHYYNTTTAPFTMPYGIDKHYYGSNYEDGSDLGIAYNMVRPNTRETGIPEGHDVRAIPIRLMHCKMDLALPGINPLGDNTHMSSKLNDATASFMYTLLSGRCPLVDEPPVVGGDAWLQWLGHKVGYETAWQMAHLTTRVPGFQVQPSSVSTNSVTSTTTETMSVRFWYRPESNVTVTVSCDNAAAAIVGPKTLVFTPENYHTPQLVTVAGIPGVTAAEDFNVVFSTSSNDEVYDGLGDSWAYSINRTGVAGLTQVDNGVSQETALQNLPLTINLNAAGSNAGNTILIGPQNGSVSWVGDSLIEYTPNNGYLGADQIVYIATVGTTQTYGCIDITVEVPDGQVNVIASDADAAEEGPDVGTFVINRTGADTSSALNVLFAMSGTATVGVDYALSHSSPVTIPMGQESVTITLTPVDDTTFGERYETAVLTIQEDPAYPIGAASATVTITDNDNVAPVADAGPNQTVYLDGAASWSPLDLSPAAWYDASDASSITESSGAVSQWNDKSGNDLHLTQANGARQPVTGTTTINGTNAVNFTNHEMVTASNPFGATIDNALVIAVHKVDNDGNQGTMFTLSGTSSSRWQAHVPYSGTAYFDCGGTGGSNRVNTDYLTNTGDNVLVSFYGSTSDNVQQIHKNGSLLVGDATGHSVSTNGNIHLGGVQGSQFQDTSIGEVIIINGTVSVEDRQKLEGYLAHKWGLAGDLPVDHPYKSESPVLAGAAATLDGSVDDVDGDPVTHSWSVVSGPGEVVFTDAAALNSQAFFSELGVYVLRLTANDGFVQDTDDVTITVELLNNTPPTTNAGPDQSVRMSGTVPWSPGDVSPVIWLDASDSSTITLNNTTVSQWDDKSGNGNHAYQETATSQPTHDAANNRLTFDGGDIFKVTNDPFNGLQNFAVISLQRWSASSSWGNAAASFHGESGNGWQLRQRSGAVDNLTFTRRGTAVTDDPTPSVTTNTADHIAVGLRADSQNLSMRHNGSQIYTTSSDTGSIAYTGTNRSAIGGRFQADSWGSAAGHLNGELKEVIVIENATDEEVEMAEGYLAHKWGLEASLPNDHPYKVTPPGGVGIQVNLAGSVTDAQQTPTATWSVVTSPNGSSVTFSDINAVDATATFNQAGTYVLRLTGDDGYEQSTDEVTITVNPALPSIYSTWAGGTFTHAFNDIEPGTNDDGDRNGNMMEFAFGTDPTISDGGSLAMDGSANGEPIAVEGAADTMEFYFVRRDDHGVSGSVSYTVQFSTDLGSFTDSAVTPTFVSDSSANSDYEVVKVAFPVGARFGRVSVDFVP